MKKQNLNAPALTEALDYFERFIFWRLKTYFNGNINEPVPAFRELPGQSPLAVFIRSKLLKEKTLNGQPVFLTFLVAAIPNIKPDFFNTVLQKWSDQNKEYSFNDLADFLAFGGTQGSVYKGIVPTIETALFIAAGTDMEERFKVLEYFHHDHFLVKEHILTIEPPAPGEPFTSSKIGISARVFDLITTRETYHPGFSMFFPARRINTDMEWDDMVLDPAIIKRIDYIRAWHLTREKINNQEDLKRKITKGFKILFHGPAGTGKSQVAKLLGKELKKDVYQIDLSQVVSKYIGETEKNLERILSAAEHEDWILLFDKTDALFGKRTEIKDAHDRYANQEISYLLQRLEDYPGLAILTTNYKQNIDEAFSRRFDLFIHFSFPKAKERIEIWKKRSPDGIKYEENGNIPSIIGKYEVTGSNILNIVKYAYSMMLNRKSEYMRIEDVIEGIKIEYEKEGRAFK